MFDFNGQLVLQSSHEKDIFCWFRDVFGVLPWDPFRLWFSLVFLPWNRMKKKLQKMRADARRRQALEEGGLHLWIKPGKTIKNKKRETSKLKCRKKGKK